MKTKHFLTTVLILTVLFTTGCSLGRQKTNEPNQKQENEQQEQTTTTTQTQENTYTPPEEISFEELMDTSTWKTFTSKKYMFGFRYPNDADLIPEGDGEQLEVCSIIHVYQNYFFKNSIWFIGFKVIDPIFYGDEYSSMNLDMDDFAKRLWSVNKYEDNPYTKGKEVGDLTKIKINGLGAYSFYVTKSFSADWGGRVLDEPHIYTIMSDGTYNYIINYPISKKEISEMILNTIQFN